MRGYRTGMAAPLLLRHPSSLEHDTGAHPERAARIVAIERALEERDWLGWDVQESPAVERAVVEAVHPAGYVRSDRGGVRGRRRRARRRHRGLRGVLPGGAARAGGAVAVVDALLGDGPRPRFGASLHRPPGHHAEPNRAMGFCLFNNVAVAARHALDAGAPSAC